MKKLLFIITILIVTTITIGNFNKQVADKERYKWDCVYWAIAAVESNFNHSVIGSTNWCMASKPHTKLSNLVQTLTAYLLYTLL